MSAEGLPLEGRRILITRPRHQSRQMCERLSRLGARPVAVPTITIAGPRPGGPLDAALRVIDRYDWVVITSANGARAVLARARALEVNLAGGTRPRWAAIGPATAAVLQEAGVRVALMPPRFLTGAVAEALDDVSGLRILLPRTDAAGPALGEALIARGATVDEVTAYRTVLAPEGSRIEVRRLIGSRAVDTVLFTSASTVRGLVRLLGEERDGLRALVIGCIGPVTAAAVADEGFEATVVASEHTTDGLIAALVAHGGGRLAGTKGDSHVRNHAPR